MLKNSKLLKGITLALALVFVLGAGVFLKLQADAQSKVIVRYVSDAGDNTTGLDEASAYTTIANATAALAKTEIAPGTEVRFIVVNRVSVPAKAIDVTVLKDTSGQMVPVTITSQHTDDPDNFADIHLCYPGTSTSPSGGSRSANVVNNVTFKDVRLVAKVNDFYTDNKDTGNVKDLYRIVGFYSAGTHVVFDQCIFTTDLPDQITGYDVWSVYNSTSSAAEGSTSITFKNGDYTNLTVYVADTVAPQWDFGITTENAVMGPVYLLSATETKTTNNALSVKAEFNNSELLDFLPCRNGNFGAANGVEVTFNDTIIQGWQKKIDGKNAKTTATLNLDIIYNFNGNTQVNQTSYTAGSGTTVNGNITSNVNGARFNSSYYLGAASTINGNVTHNITNGYFASMFCGANYTGTVYGDVVVNVAGGTFADCYFGSGANAADQHIKGTITNNISGGTFSGQWYGGGGNGTFCDVVNNISGGQFRNHFIGGGGRKGKNTPVQAGTIINNISGGEIGAIKINKGKQDTETNRGIYLGNYDGNSTAVINNISGGKFRATTYAGTFNGVAGSITTYISGDAEFVGYTTSELQSMGATTSVVATAAYFYGASACADTSPIQNNVSGGVFHGQFIGGNSDKVVGNITNNISGGHFLGASMSGGPFCSFLGGGYANASDAASITNHISGGTFEGNVYLGGRNTANKRAATDPKLPVNSVISGGIFNGERILLAMEQDLAASHASARLAIKPDDSSNPLYFGCYNKGLEKKINNKYYTFDHKITYHGGEKPILIKNNTVLAGDELIGGIHLVQTASWTNNHAYLTIHSEIDESQVRFSSANDGVNGTAKITVGAQSKLTGANGTALKAPSLYGISFTADYNLRVNFFAPESEVEAYFAEMGNLYYSISVGGKTVFASTVTDLSQLDVENGFVKFSGNFGVPATKYGEKIAFSIAGNVSEYTVYELLEIGIQNVQDNDALVDLLKAIYNFGVESETLAAGSTTAGTYFDSITYTGTYNGAASTQSKADGYRFVASGLTLGEEVSLNFYLDLPAGVNLSDLEFTANSAGASLAASRVSVKQVVGASYDAVVSLKLPINRMDEVYTLTVASGDTELATCTNSVLYSCAGYIAQDNGYADVAASLLAYIEKAEAAL